jgi:hypothetical protein
MTEAIRYGGWGRKLSAIGIQATSFVHVRALFTVCERVICVNVFLVVGDVVIAPVVVAIVKRLES